MNVVFATLWISIFLQVFTGILDAATLMKHVEPSFRLIYQLLMGEFAVQVVEASFYVYWAYNFKQIQNITPQRYFDWMLTTPTMLITLILYSIYLDYKEKQKDTSTLLVTDLIQQHQNHLVQVVGLNALMLGLGYLGEIHVLPTMVSVGLGFIPFLMYYYIIYTQFSVHSEEGRTIFYYFFVFWSLYGVAALFPYTIKNSMYNILDIFAKNFFGLFLVYVLLKN